MAAPGAMEAEEVVELSLVVPVYDEEGSLRELLAEVEPVLRSITDAYEIVFVDDGSTDGGGALLEEFARTHARVAVWRLDRNRGLTTALLVGFRRSRGRIVASMDADLQNDPADLPRLVEAVRGGADFACGWRRDRRDPFVKRVSSRIANAARNRRLGSTIHDVTCPLKAMRREVLSVFLPLNGIHRFLPDLARTAGYSVVEIPVGHRARKHGRSKYGVWNRLFRGMRDLRAVRWMKDRWITERATRVGGPPA
jgi:glycosyltransferase involved in cell wall biosynthesis